MSIRLLKHHEYPPVTKTWWDVNGEFVLTEKETPSSTYLSVSDLRRREWGPRIDAMIELAAREQGAFVRMEGGIDVVFVVIDASQRDQVRDAIARHRMSTESYEQLTQDDARLAVMERVLELGEEADWTSIDEELVAARFPLGYRARTAIEDLEASGALRLVRTKGRCRLVATDVGRAIVTKTTQPRR